MLKREIKYTSFDGEEITEEFYFNLTKAELIEWSVDFEGGMEAFINKMIVTKDGRTLIQEFKKIILLAYGVKSDDGRFFRKNDQIREDFLNSAAYDGLFMELTTDESAIANFVIGVLPKDMAEEASKQVQTVATLPVPPPPTT